MAYLRRQESSEGEPTILLDAGNAFLPQHSRLASELPEIGIEQAKVVRDYLVRAGVKIVCIGDQDLILGTEILGELLPPNILGISTNLSTATFKSCQYGVVDVAGLRGIVLSLTDRRSFQLQGLESRGISFTEMLAAARSALEKAGKADFVIVAIHAHSLEEVRQVFEDPCFPSATVVIDAGHLIDGTGGNTARLIGNTPIVSPRRYGTEISTIELAFSRDYLAPWRNFDRMEAMEIARTKLAAVAAELGHPQAGSNLERKLKAIEEQSRGFDQRLRDEQQQLAQSHIFRVRAVEIRQDWPVDADFESRVMAYKSEIARLASLAQTSGSRFRGATECGSCHKEQFENWKSTLHFQAFRTLESGSSEKNPSCLECHVSGYGSPGGPMGIEHLERFAGVQCESCHVPVGDKKHPGAGLAFAPVNSTTCVACHNERQDPRFDYEKYLKVGTCQSKLEPGQERVPRK